MEEPKNQKTQTQMSNTINNITIKPGVIAVKKQKGNAYTDVRKKTTNGAIKPGVIAVKKTKSLPRNEPLNEEKHESLPRNKPLNEEKQDDDTRPVILVMYEQHSIPKLKQYSNHPDVKPSDKAYLHQIMKSADVHGRLRVEYCYAKGRNSGRLYAKGASYQRLSRRLRNSLAQDHLCDLDIVNCNPTLLLQLCQKNNWVAPHLENLVNNRKEILEKVSEDLVCSYEQAKDLFLALINAGSYEAWAKKYCVERLVSDFINDFACELKEIRKLIWDTHPHYHDEANEKHEHKKKQGKYSAGPEATCLHYVIADIEGECILAISQYLKSIGFEVSTLIFDGGLVKGQGLNQKAIEASQKYCLQQTGCAIKLLVKPMNETLPENPFCTLLDDFAKRKYVAYYEFYEKFVNQVQMPEHRVTLMISAPGTGKTTYMQEETKRILQERPNTPIIIPSARVAITQQHMGSFGPLGFTHYKQDKQDKQDKNGSESLRVVTTIDSLMTARQRPGVSILDEFELSLSHLFGATLKNKRTPTIQKLLQITTYAKRVFALDGDIGDLSITFFRRIFDELTAYQHNTKQQVLVARNLFRPQRKRVIFANKRRWWNQLHNLLQDDQSKIFISCDSKQAAQAIAERIKKWCKQNRPERNDNVLLYTADDGNKEELTDASSSWADAKVVVCSPTVGPATDYNNKAVPFTAILGYYMTNGHTIGALQVKQTLKRPRDDAFRPPPEQTWDYFIFCTRKATTDDKFKKTPKQIPDIHLKLRQLQLSMQTLIKPAEVVELDVTGQAKIKDDITTELYCQFIRNRNLSRGQLLPTLQYMLEFDKHSVSHLCTLCKSEFDSAQAVTEHEEQAHPKQKISFNDEILCDQFGEFIKAELWQKEMDEYDDLIYNHKNDQYVQDSVKALHLRAKDARAREWLNISPNVHVPKDTVLHHLMFDEKSQNSYRKFELFCRNDHQLRCPFTEHETIHLTQDDKTILNILHLIETKVLNSKRLQCLSWDNTKIQTLIRKKIKHLPPGLKEMLETIQNFEIGEKLSTIGTMYDAYQVLCESYKKFVRGVTFAGSSPDLILCTRHHIDLTKIPDERLKPAKHPQITCKYCNTSKNPQDFHKRRGMQKCKKCQDGRFNLYSFKSEANDTIAQFIEIITSQPSYNTENYRLTQDEFKSFTHSRQRAYSSVWEQPQTTIDQLLDNREPLFDDSSDS